MTAYVVVGGQFLEQSQGHKQRNSFMPKHTERNIPHVQNEILA